MPQINTQPYEIIGAPLTVWFASVGTAFPLVNENPSGLWTKIGSNGDLNYGDEGITISHSQSVNFFRAVGDAGSRKVFRTEEDQKIKLMLYDLTLEQYRLAINSNPITQVNASIGIAGTKKIGLSRGLNVATMALLLRGLSPYGADLVAQYEVPIAVQIGTPEPVYKKGDAVGLMLEWATLVDANATSETERFGRLVVQTDDPDT